MGKKLSNATPSRDDTREALDLRTKNPVWTELVRHAGGPTLKLSRKVLDVALRMAAYHRRITDETFRALDSGRKERLLPLGDPARMRQARSRRRSLRRTRSTAAASERSRQEVRRTG